MQCGGSCLNVLEMVHSTLSRFIATAADRTNKKKEPPNLNRLFISQHGGNTDDLKVLLSFRNTLQKTLCFVALLFWKGLHDDISVNCRADAGLPPLINVWQTSGSRLQVGLANSTLTGETRRAHRCRRHTRRVCARRCWRWGGVRVLPCWP